MLLICCSQSNYWSKMLPKYKSLAGSSRHRLPSKSNTLPRACSSAWHAPLLMPD
jgi:hypothetical protein